MSPDHDPQSPDILAGTDGLEPDALRETYLETGPTVDELTDALKAEDYSEAQLEELKETEEQNKHRKTALEAIRAELDEIEADVEDVEREPGPLDTDPEIDSDAVADGPDADSDDEPGDESKGDDALETDADAEADDSDVDTDAEAEADVSASPATDDTMSTTDYDLHDAEANNSRESPHVQQMTQGAGATPAGVAGVNLPDPNSADAPETVRIIVESRRQSFAGNEYRSGEHKIPYSLRVKQALEVETNDVYLSEDDPFYPESHE